MIRPHRRPAAVPPRSGSVRATAWALALGASAASAAPLGPPRLPGTDAVDRIVTALAEVQSGSLDGLDYFTIAIASDAVGPLRCRGRVLKADTAGAAAAERREAMERVALAAMLGADAVLVTVPLSPDACRDGRPTFTGLDLLPASP